MINKKQKFEESYMQYGFNSIVFSNKERPECLLCNNALSNDLKRPGKLSSI